MNTERPGRNQKLGDFFVSSRLRGKAHPQFTTKTRRITKSFPSVEKSLSKNAEENSFQPVKDFALVATVAAPPQPNLALRLRSLAVKGWASLARVVKDDSKSVARSSGDGAGSVAHVSLIVSPAPRHRPP